MNKKALLFLGLALVVLVGLFLAMRKLQPPTPEPVVAIQTESLPAATPITQELPKPKIFEIEVRQGQRVAGPAVLQVQEGDDVQLQITTDKADELHVHGYDLHLKLQANTPAMLAFRAEHSGRFDYELHHSHLDLGALEVTPK